MNKNVTYTDGKLNVYTLHSALNCQRSIDEKHVKEIYDIWNDGSVEPIRISQRNGENRIVDGQHTVKAWIKRIENGLCDDVMIKCIIAHNMNNDDENEWFAIEAKKSKGQSCKSVYEARVLSKNDNSINSLITDLQESNLFIKVFVPSGNNVIEAIDTVEKIHNNMNKDEFIKCFIILQKTWCGDIESLRASFIKGMVKFYNTYNYAFDDKRFIMALSKISAKTIKDEADSDKITKDIGIKYARILNMYYNKRLGKGRQLKISKLED
jgi:hypothetical protein